MHTRALLGWLLVGGFCASVSCGGGNSVAVRGFGLPCETNEECTTYDLQCDTAEQKCVQCFSRDDCANAQLCVSGKCEAPQDCEDSRDCPADQVCNEDSKVCVQCLESRDCPTGQKCAAQTCVDQDFCEFTSDCEDGLVCDPEENICVACRTNSDCSSQRVCEDHECVAPGGEGGEGGTSTAGTDSGGTAGSTGGTRAGSNNGGSAGSAGSAGTAGSSGNGGSGGTPPICDCPGLNEVCTPDERCVSSGVVDDFVSCDDEILEIEGRSGVWAGEADTDINFMKGFGDPGSGWADHTCAAWATCGVAQGATETSFAFIGFMLNNGDPYSLVGFTGIQIQLESSNTIQVILKTTGGGYFQYLLPPIVGSNLRTAPIGSMTPMNNSLEAVLNPATVYEVQFSPTTPTSCGYAIHRVVLY